METGVLAGGFDLCMGCMSPLHGETICPVCGYTVGTKTLQDYHLVPGTVLMERYIVGRVLGYGGFGVTYIAYDTALDLRVAIKEYLPGEFCTRMPGAENIAVYPGEREGQFRNGLESFQKEAQTLSELDGESGIVRIRDVFSENNTAYIVMEYLDGMTLGEMLKKHKNKKMSFAEAMKYMRPVLMALDKVHAHGIMHRDIAPSNIFILNDDAVEEGMSNVKLIDFGASRYATTTHTRSLSVILKPGYAPEEQYRTHGDQGPWTDVYAAAATIYRLITGKMPPEASERRIEDKLIPPRKNGAKINKSQETAILNALNVSGEHRTRSAGEFLEELDGKNIKRRKDAPTLKKPMKTWLKVMIAASALLVALVSYVLICHLQL